MTATENTALAAEIAARFGETGERPRAQLARMIGLMGAEWVDFVAVEAEMYLGFETLGQNFTRQGVSRTSGGSFFATARHFGNAALASGRITRRDFFRCFTDRPPTPRAPPVKAPRLPRMPTGACVTAGNVRRQPRAAVPEVYVVRGRAGAGR